MGLGIVQQFANSPIVNEFITVTGTGGNITQFPSGTSLMIRFKADPDNSGNFYLGDNQAEADWPFSPGDDTGWIACNRLEYFYYRAATAGDKLIAWIER